mgnify:CR=1 FL=1
MKLKKFFKNKKILITGHTGFKGSWLTSCLLAFGANVVGFSKNDEGINIFLCVAGSLSLGVFGECRTRILAWLDLPCCVTNIITHVLRSA